MFTFGQTPTYQSDENFQLNVSSDKKALTVTFSDLEVTVKDSKSSAPMSTRIFELVLPLEGNDNDEKVEIEFAIQGFVFTLEGATASIVSSVNGQTTVADFPANLEQSFIHTLKFVAHSPSECRLCVFLLVGRDSKNANAEATFNVSSIDAQILPITQ